MSECQYCEFQAVDKPIDSDGLKEIEEVSSRAEVTPTSLVNVYNYGNFHGDEKQFMKC